MNFLNSGFFKNRKYSRFNILKLLPVVPSMNMLANQSVCDKNSWIFLTFSRRFSYIASLVGTVKNRPFWGCFLWDHDVFELFVSVCRPQVHKNTNAPLILKVWDVILFYLWKTYNGALLGFFREALDFFGPEMAPSYTRDHFKGPKESRAPQKPRERPTLNVFHK